MFVLTAAERWLLDTFKGASRARARGWARRVDPSLLEERHRPVELSAEEAWIERDGDAVREEIVNELLHRLETDEGLSTISERVRLVMTLFHVEHLAGNRPDARSQRCQQARRARARARRRARGGARRHPAARYLPAQLDPAPGPTQAPVASQEGTTATGAVYAGRGHAVRDSATLSAATVP